jgi:hypothetical protein
LESEMHYVAYELSKREPNIIVDGAANDATELVLSHWPNSNTPEALKDDLSAQIVFNYLSRPEAHVAAKVVSNNHFDADGLVGIYSMLNPAEAQAIKQLLIDVAAAGDFDLCADREAARISFVIDAWINPSQSPLNKGVFALDYAGLANVLYEELLPRFSKIIEKIDQFEKFWTTADQLLDKTESALQEGRIKITEFPAIDLAVVTLPESNLPPSQTLHRMAIHNKTQCLRILLAQENNYELYYRYETWVELHSRKTQPRIDLRTLANRLTKQESMDGKWIFSGINDLTPTLKLTGVSHSKIQAPQFKAQIIEFIEQAQVQVGEPK